MSLLEEVRQWAKVTTHRYKNFLWVDTSIYWIIDSINDFCLNLPQEIHNIYVANFTRCFETILVNMHDILFEGTEFLISVGVKVFKSKYPTSAPTIWFKTNEHEVKTRAIWASTCPTYGNWSQMSVTKSWHYTNGLLLIVM